MRPMRQAGYRPAAMVAKNASDERGHDARRGPRARAPASRRRRSGPRYTAPAGPSAAAAPSARPSTAPIVEMTPTSTRCCMKICRRLAPSARRTPVIGALFRNFASSRPTVFSRHTARNAKARPDQHAVVVADHVVVDQPLVGLRQAVVERARVAAAVLLLLRVVVEERLELVVRRLRPATRPTSGSRCSRSSGNPGRS